MQCPRKRAENYPLRICATAAFRPRIAAILTKFAL
jgi:hypothetical protein